MNRITKNNDFIEYFLRGGKSQKKCGNLKIEDNKLINYNTVIAEITGEYEIIINMTKYSSSTSRIQNYLLKDAECVFGRYGITIVDNIDYDTQKLA